MFVKGRIRVLKRLDVKLAAWYALTFLTIIFLIFGFLDYRLRNNILKEIDRMLVDEAREIINGILKEPEDSEGKLEEYGKIASKRKYYQIAFRVLDREGNPLYSHSQFRSFAFPPADVSHMSNHEFITKNIEAPGAGSPFRLAVYYYKEDGALQYVVEVATYLRMMEKNMRNFRRNLGIAFVLALLWGSVGGWILSLRTLRPMENITAATRRITAAQLGERLPLQGTDDELDQLAVTINAMLERLEESFRKLTRFTADAAHELRTPIAVLKGETEVLLSQSRSPEEYRDVLGNNLERLNFLTKIINDLLLLSQADEGRQILKVEPIRLSELLRELWDAFNMVATQKSIDFALDGPEELIIEGDSIKLKQLFSNLIDNAIKYTPDGGEIRLSVRPETGRVSIVLKDSGIGIPADDLPRIFDRFYRVDKSRYRAAGGAGLGLSICQWIVKAHQGGIEVASQLSHGTTVTVTFPTGST